MCSNCFYTSSFLSIYKTTFSIKESLHMIYITPIFKVLLKKMEGMFLICMSSLVAYERL